MSQHPEPTQTSGHPPQSPPPPASNGMSIAAIILAFIAPLVGFILGLVARSSAKKEGRSDGLATAATIIGGILTLLVALLGILAIVISVVFPTKFDELTSRVDPSPPPTPEAVVEGNNRIVLDIGASTEVDSELLDAVGETIAGRLDRAQVTLADISASGEHSLTVTLPDDAPESEVLRAAALLEVNSDPGFYEFVGEFQADPLTEEELAEADLSEEEKTAYRTTCPQLITEPVLAFSGEVLCPISHASKFVIGDVLFDAAEISSVAKTDDSMLLVGLTTAGGQTFADISEDIAENSPAGQNRIVLVTNREVLVAPTITARVPGAALQLYIDDGTVDEVYAALLLISKSATIEVTAVHSG